MHFLSLVWTVIIFLFVAGLFMDKPKSNNFLWFWDIIIYVIIVLLVIALILKSKYSKNKYQNLSEEEKEKQKKLDDIKEWSRRNKC